MNRRRKALLYHLHEIRSVLPPAAATTADTASPQDHKRDEAKHEPPDVVPNKHRYDIDDRSGNKFCSHHKTACDAGGQYGRQFITV
jgi:hypothetical protein